MTIGASNLILSDIYMLHIDLPLIHTELLWKWYIAGWMYYTSLCTPHCILHYV